MSSQVSSPIETTTNPAETYESYMVPTLFGPWASYLVKSANPQPGERVLDVATGTGVIARRVAPLVGANGKVAGLDVNPNMLEVARSAAEREGLGIEWHQGKAEDLPFPDGSFDLVMCQFAMMFFTDRHAALAEMYRVLNDGGRVWLSVFESIDRHSFYQALDDVIQQRLGMSGVQDIFSLGDTGELQALLEGAGFKRVVIEPASMTARFPDPDGFIAGEIDVDTAAIPSMQHLDVKARQAITTAIREEMKVPLREVTENNQVVLPFHVHIVRAEKQ